MDIGEVVRHNKTRHRAHHMGFAVQCRGSDPVAFFGTVPLPTDAEHQGLKRGGQHQGRNSDPLVTWIYRAIAGGYPFASRHRARIPRNVIMSTEHHGRLRWTRHEGERLRALVAWVFRAVAGGRPISV